MGGESWLQAPSSCLLCPVVPRELGTAVRPRAVSSRFRGKQAFLGLHRPSPLLAAMFPGLKLPRERQKGNIVRSPTHVAAFPTRGSTNMAAISPWTGLVRSPPPGGLGGLGLTTRAQPTLDESCPETEIRLLVGNTRLVVRSRFPWGARRTGSPGLLPKQVDTVSALILFHR